MRKSILFLSSWYPSKNHPFAGDFVQRHAKAVSTLNDVTVLHAARNDNQNLNYEVEIKENEIKEIIVYYKGSFFKPFNFFKRLIALQKGFKQVPEIDLVHLNVTYPAGIFALILKFFKNKKYIITEHWTGFRKDQFEKINFIEQFLIKLILKDAEMFLPVSSDLGENMLRVYPKKKIEIIPNVVETEIFKLDENPISNSIKKFLHLSSLKDEHKNITGMLNVAKRLLDGGFRFEFHLGGTGSSELIDRFNLENNTGNSIFYFPFISYEKVPEKMWEFDCFVLFSNFETQSCVRLESFSTGLPFISSNIGGINEFFPENFGILVEKGNEDELFKAMVQVINGKTFADKNTMHQYAVEHFSYASISQKFQDIYDSIVNDEKTNKSN